LDENGETVDWWFIYKMPNGFKYAYMDAASKEYTIAPFKDRTLDRLDGALGNTLHQIYTDKKGLGYALYNDDRPTPSSKLKEFVSYIKSLVGAGTTSATYAHAKGVLATDAERGFWLVHSVPKFPDLGPSTFTWTADDTYGQSFLCMSIAAATVNEVATQLKYFHPDIFDYNMPAALARTVPNLAAVIKGDSSAGTNVVDITTHDGQVFTSFAKDRKCNSDLYEELVSPTLKIGFNWETWRRGDECPSVCGDKKGNFDAINVMAMKIGTVSFGYTKDHAKIGIATSYSKTDGGYICVGDINRMESQRKRGGGTVCFVTKTLYKALASSVTSVEDCSDASEVDRRVKV